MNSRLLSSTFRIATIGLAGTFALNAASAVAGQAEHDMFRQQRSTVVIYAEREMTTTRDLAALYARIDRAAREVCGRIDGRDLARRADWRNCHAAALDAAIADVNDARLTRLHKGDSAAASQQVASTR